MNMKKASMSPCRKEGPGIDRDVVTGMDFPVKRQDRKDKGRIKAGLYRKFHIFISFF